MHSKKKNILPSRINLPYFITFQKLLITFAEMFQRDMKSRLISFLLLLSVLAATPPCHAAGFPQTDRTRGLIRELLIKLDSTDVYVAKTERKIDATKAKLPGNSEAERYDLYFRIAEEYSNYRVDSALLYLKKAEQTARGMGRDSLRISAELKRARLLSVSGFYVESNEILLSIPRNALRGDLFISYYQAWALLYHELYSVSNDPDGFEKAFREKYNIYRDSLLTVADTMSILYLRNMERKAARAGDFDEARRYNAIRLSTIKDPGSGVYATCLYDRFLIAYYYERKLTGEAVDDLLQSAIIEVENSNHNIASLLRVETLLVKNNELKAAQKISNYYYSSLMELGSRKRIIEGGEQAIKIMDRNHQQLLKRNRELLVALAFISLLLGAMVVMLVRINRSRLKISSLNDNLEQSGKVSKSYVGVVFQLYSSYIKRLDVFRTKIHASLKKGHVEQALELTSPSGDIIAAERKELFHNFDTAFVDIYPDFIRKVNDCLKPEEQIVPKRTEILTTELRILALIKLGIEDSAEIAEMLHCSVKTVYNLRSVLKTRLAVPEEEFKEIISRI